MPQLCFSTFNRRHVQVRGWMTQHIITDWHWVPLLACLLLICSFFHRTETALKNQEMELIRNKERLQFFKVQKRANMFYYIMSNNMRERNVFVETSGIFFVLLYPYSNRFIVCFSQMLLQQWLMEIFCSSQSKVLSQAQNYKRWMRVGCFLTVAVFPSIHRAVVFQSIQERERCSSGCWGCPPGEYGVSVQSGPGLRWFHLPRQCGGNWLSHNHDQWPGHPGLG